MFGRKKKSDADPVDATEDPTSAQGGAFTGEADGSEGSVETAEGMVDESDGTAGENAGPWSLEDLDDDRETVAAGRLDLGSVLLVLPAGAQFRVDMTPAGVPQAVHIMVHQGRITVAAFAAPKSPGQWREVATEIADTLRKDTATVSVESGPWGREVTGSTAGGDLRFIGVDGYRWMIRGAVAGPAGSTEAGSPLVTTARAVIANAVVDRGSDPHPVRTPLPITLPDGLAQQLAAAQQQQIAAQHQAAQQQAAQQQEAQQQAAQGDPARGEAEPAPDDSTPRRRGSSGSAMQQLG